MREKKVAYTRSKASSEASDDASPDAFCVQSVPDGASRSARACMTWWTIGVNGAQELAKPIELPEDEEQIEGEVRADGGDYKMQIH